MKLAVLLFAFLWQASPDGPANAPNPQYPLHLQVLVTKGASDRYGAHGNGRGNILGTPAEGIDFSYDCSAPMLNNGPTEFYQARWKKQDRALEILMQRIGSDHIDKCDINVAVKAMPYTPPWHHKS
jgi:hypothetical protein